MVCVLVQLIVLALAAVVAVSWIARLIARARTGSAIWSSASSIAAVIRSVLRRLAVIRVVRSSDLQFGTALLAVVGVSAFGRVLALERGSQGCEQGAERGEERLVDEPAGGEPGGGGGGGRPEYG